MTLITFNIGYGGDGLSGGILSHYPNAWELKSFKQFKKEIRKKKNIKTLFDLAKKSYVPPSSMLIIMRIREEEYERLYTIRMINVREYKKYWEIKYKKQWKPKSKD